MEPYKSTLPVGRRTLLKAAGVLVGAGGVGAVTGRGPDTGPSGIDPAFLNWRTVEARKVWERGYRGRPDRALALSDTGISARHADLAPWNGIRFVTDGDGIELDSVTTEVRDVPVTESVTVDSLQFEGARAGGGGVGLTTFTRDFLVADLLVTPERLEEASGTFTGTGSGLLVGAGQTSDPFTVPTAAEVPFDADDIERFRVDATLSWEPTTDDGPEPMRADFELRDADGTTVESSNQGSGPTSTGSTPERRIVAEVEPGAEYSWFAYGDRGVTSVRIEWDTQAVIDRPRGAAPDPPGDLVGYRIDATLAWNADTPGPQQASVEARLLDEAGSPVASAGPGGIDTSEDNTASLEADVPPGQYRFEVITWRGAASWTLDTMVAARVKKRDSAGEVVTERREVTTAEPFEGSPLPAADGGGDGGGGEGGSGDGGGGGGSGGVDAQTPKVIGWWDAGPRRGHFPKKPRDPNGHGSHVAGIMAGTGRGSVIDSQATEVYEPRAVLVPGEFIEYEVDVPATGSAFASAIGTGIVVEIEAPDGRTVHTSPLRGDSSIADEPAVHGSGTATYTVRAKPYETEAATEEAAREAQEGTPTAGRLERIAVGVYRDADAVLGERVEDGGRAVHAGLAPNGSLVGLGGLSPVADALVETADDLAATFGIRAINMSWGPIAGLPVGMAGGVVAGMFEDRVLSGVKRAAEAGILTVAAAGNSFTPANGNGYPAVADEAISVVATGPLDGITSYSSGGIGGLDEDERRVYAKPDVTAPGGDVEPDVAGPIAVGTADARVEPDLGYPVPSRYELVRSVRAADPAADVRTFEPRDYASFGGSSMAAPYVAGTVALVAQAMEEDCPAAIELPPPAEAGFGDVMRLKQAVLATATETALTAAPYHLAKNVPSAPTYTHGGRDPYEGYGRVNPDAAVDAVSRDLFAGTTAPGDTPPGGTTSRTIRETVGLTVPVDARAVAGYVEAARGTLEVSATVSHLSGGNKDMARGPAHVDLFVYDAESPGPTGEPAVVASAVGEDGSASVTVEATPEDETAVYYVVTKLVNVPGAVNGFDVRAHLDIALEFGAGSGTSSTRARS